MMLSVVIPTDGVEQSAVATLAALVPGAAAGLVREVLLVDRSDSGVIERVADVTGCRFLPFEGTRGAAMAAKVCACRSITSRSLRNPVFLRSTRKRFREPSWLGLSTVNYRTGRIFIRHDLTHQEYDRGKWKPRSRAA